MIHLAGALAGGAVVVLLLVAARVIHHIRLIRRGGPVEHPLNARVVFDDGRVVPTELVYAGLHRLLNDRSPWGTRYHTWYTVIAVAVADPGRARVVVDYVPPSHVVRLQLRYPPGYQQGEDDGEG